MFLLKQFSALINSLLLAVSTVQTVNLDVQEHTGKTCVQAYKDYCYI